MGYQRLSISHVRGLDSTIKDIQETLTDLLLLSDSDQSVAVSVYLMTYEEYAMLPNKL
jgi:hypothetical protein